MVVILAILILMIFNILDAKNDVIPLLYDLHIMAPLQAETSIFEGSLSITMKCLNKTDTIFLNSKNLKLVMGSTVVYSETEPDVKFKIEKFFESTDDETVGMKLEKFMEPNFVYVLEMGRFSGKINSPYSYGFFHSDISPSSNVYVTQFQMNFARTVFPCFDEPNLKANLKLTLEHPPDTLALSNMKHKTVEFTSSGWLKSEFYQSPKMSTYTMAFSLLPVKQYSNVTVKSHNGVNIALHYNNIRISLSGARNFLNIAKYAMEFFENTFNVPQPLDKLDLIVVPKFAIFGMENWGMIVLNEEFLLKNDEAEFFSLISHEISHQWFGNLVTNFDWTYLCVQEGLAEHYTRRVVKSWYTDKGDFYTYEKYLVARYLTAMQHETDNVDLWGGVQIYRSLPEAGNFCFGKAPFVFDMAENLLGSTAFDERINLFLKNFLFDSYQFEDLLKYFESILSPASLLIKFWITNGGYPSVFVDENGKVEQKQLIKFGDENFREIFQLWPVPLMVSHGFASDAQQQRINATWLTTKNVGLTGFPRNIGDWYLINENFTFFYRVNYDHYNWYLLSEQLLRNDTSLNLITQIQLVDDFCFFYSLGLIDKVNSRISSINIAGVIKRLQIKTGLQLENYFRGC